jgi:hypothetical protein
MPTTLELRTGIADLVTIAAADLEGLWRSVDTADAARDALSDVLPALVDVYGAAAAALAADWYDDFRDEVAVPGRFTAIPADLGDTGGDVLARWGVAPLFAAEPDWSAARSLIEGGLQRRIANAARTTVTVSAVQDPGAEGWQRAGDGSCGFCTMLIGRGAVYSEAGADFAAHDHCNCAAVPAFRGQPRPVKPYTPSSRASTPRERAAVREYLRANQ